MGITQRLTPHETVSRGVIRAVAEMDDTSPVEIQPPLYEVVDPDALEALVGTEQSSSEHSRHVAFTYGEYEVEISNDGPDGERTVTVTNASRAPEQTDGVREQTDSTREQTDSAREQTSGARGAESSARPSE